MDDLTHYFEQRGVATTRVTAEASVPLRFSDPWEEHWCVRRAAGLFDFSFMSCFVITGTEAEVFLETLQTRTLRHPVAGRILYTLLCREDGTVFNDATVWCFGAQSYWLFTGRRTDRDHIHEVAGPFDVEVEERSGQHAVIAVQGPRAAAVLSETLGEAPVAGLGFFRFRPVTVFGQRAWLGRLGYSGERGYELVVDARAAVAVWEGLRDAGARGGLAECGFEAADSLRIEAGFILFSHELQPRVTPAALGYGRVVDWQRRVQFIGARRLRERRHRPPPVRLVGLVAPRIRAGESLKRLLRRPEGHPAAERLVEAGRGWLTSAAYSPLFGQPLGLGYVAAADGHYGTRVYLAGQTPARVARLPYYDPPRRRMRG